MYSPAIRSPVLDSDAPPPPPPKPKTSRRGTPQLSSPSFFRPLQQPSSQSLDDDRYYQSDSQAQYTTIPGIGMPVPEQYPRDSGAQISALSEPPSVEDGWLPDIVNDKSKWLILVCLLPVGPNERTVELQSMLPNPSLLSALSTLHPSYAASQQQVFSLLESNKALTMHLLELQSCLESLRASTESLLLTHQSLEVSWRKKQAEMDTALAPWSPKALYQRLVAAVAEQEAVCQAVEESFLEGDREHGRASDREVTDWVRRVRAEAAKLESRREARARWDEGRVGGWR
ncbi:hypothetical protein V8E54_011787 [Elaphomyces granulatus]